MITLEEAIPGTEVIYVWEGQQTKTIITGLELDPELGPMIKSDLYPGGMPADRFELASPIVSRTAIVIFETPILDEKEPLQITAALIRQKSKPLTDLVIENIFDQDGYDRVKSAKNRAVKTRTTIEKMEKAHNATLKAEYEGKKKEVTEYTATLYEACREVENALQAKLTAIDDAKEAEVKRLAEEKREKTEVREAKMFELGLTWNGQQFIGLGAKLTKDYIYGLTAEMFDTLVSELEGAQMESSVTGNEAGAEIAIPAGMEGKEPPPFMGQRSASAEPEYAIPARAYPTAVFEREIPGAGLRVVITKGVLGDPDGDAQLVNARILESPYYVQVVK